MAAGCETGTLAGFALWVFRSEGRCRAWIRGGRLVRPTCCPRYFFPVAVVQGKAISLWLRCLDGGFTFLYIAAEHLAEEPCRTCVHAIPAALCRSKDGRLRKFRRWRPHSRAPWLVWSRTMSVRGWLSDLLNGTGGRAWPVRSLPDRGSIAARNNGNINSGPQNSEQFSILCQPGATEI